MLCYICAESIAMGIVSEGQQRDDRGRVRPEFGDSLLLVQADLGRVPVNGLRRRPQVVDRVMPVASLDRCLFHRDERHPVLWKGKSCVECAIG
jgi:hypothetical protein